MNVVVMAIVLRLRPRGCRHGCDAATPKPLLAFVRQSPSDSSVAGTLVQPRGVAMNEDNAALLRRAWAAYDSGDAEAFADCLTDDWVEHRPSGEVSTLADERKTMSVHSQAFPDKHTLIHAIVAADDMVACYCTTRATHTGDYLGLSPTGQRVEVDEMMFNRIEGGRIAETWVITAGDGFYRQLTGRSAPDDLDNMG
jgi:predicted ester cyclase